MKVYDVGPDELNRYDLEQVGWSYQWIVYWYENGGYDGSGYGVGLREDGLLDTITLGHCSCYGPISGNTWETQTVEKFFEQKISVHDYDHREEVINKVRELLS